ncbi:MAG: ATP-dependent RNA helicase HrpA [Pseudonocardiales bacterium]|nr:ATP-dependent RNA helicase HrpA [Pseudonocardiales bacterium]
MPPVPGTVQQNEWRSRTTPVVCQLHTDTVSTCNPPVTSALGYVTIVGESSADLRIARRAAAVPQIDYPQALPISQHTGEIAAAIRDHQVVVIAGETGSGKTTQIPKICLELGRGIRGAIGHTQPRRLAARTVAERIAEELDVPIGGAVGWKVRFTDHISDDTLVKLMTDGILLAEIQSDPLLRQYDTLIIDEAHERSLNIDFILGYLKQLLPRRPDLRLIITSATIDPERFSRYFDGAPVIEVSGRTFPVEIRYRPYGVDRADDCDQTQAICDAVAELRREGLGDILIFLSGEREIRDTRDALHALELPDTEILPLYARLSAAEQHRVFQQHRTRRIVLATNVAETSLTVPGIRYVIDPGTARISRYSRRLKVQRLPIEPISQASATQRAGRCGRTSDGICIRLYSVEDFQSRPEFTDPEILRTHLASVILQMAALNLGEVAAFGFIDPPDRRQISDGVALLSELGALQGALQGRQTPRLAGLEEHPTMRLTRIGRTLAQLPLDPRLARMVVAAKENGCLHEVLVIVAALSIQDPRERPTDAEAAADAQHARFASKDSDFLSFLNLWRHLHEQQQALSSNQFRKLCKTEFLHYLRVREWQDLHGQLRRIIGDLGMTSEMASAPSPPGAPADPQQVHISLLTGLLSHIGLLDPETRDYLGARGARFAVFPGSALFRKSPRWVMAAELVETSRLWGRMAARIEPQWVEPLAGHLVKRSYSEPHWERKRGAVVAYEKVTLYGIPIVASRKADYGKIDPELSRELFLRHALVEGDWETRHAFFQANRALLDDVGELEARARRRDILVDDETLFTFYDQRIPAEVVSARHFDSWWRKVSKIEPDLLDFKPAMLITGDAVSGADYPDSWPLGTLALDLSYQFEPGADADGVTVHVPLPVLNQLTAAPFTWQVPGLRQELVVALLKSLPKPLRRQLVPVPDHAKALLARMTPYREPLPDTMERELAGAGVPVRREDWRLDQVPDHLKITFRVSDGDRTLAQGNDLGALTRQLQPQLRTTLAAAGTGLQRRGLRSWDIGTLPQTHQQEQAGHLITAYPALVDEGDTVAVELLPTEAEQRRAMWAGTRRLLLLAVPGVLKSVQRGLDRQAKLVLARNPDGTTEALLADCVDCAADALIAACGGPPRDEDGFARLADRAHGELADAARAVLAHVQRSLTVLHSVEARLAELTAAALAPAVADIRVQLASLVSPGFVTATGAQRLADLTRYLQAIGRRLDKLPRDPDRDRDWMHRVQTVAQDFQELRRQSGSDEVGDDPELQRIRWMIEELRVSYFAQELRTPYPVSDKRIYQAMDELAGSFPI